MYTAPAVRQARKDMMAITTVSALPAMEARGTICAVVGWKYAWKRAGMTPASRAFQG